LVLAIEPQNRKFSTIQLSKPFIFNPRGFDDVAAMWQWDPHYNPVSLSSPLSFDYRWPSPRLQLLLHLPAIALARGGGGLTWAAAVWCTPLSLLLSALVEVLAVAVEEQGSAVNP
jgi:hypothetical protein